MDSWTQTLADKENANPRVNSSTRQTSRKGLYNPRTTMPGVRTEYSFKRIQFPVRLAYAMTINKSQGQTLQKVGISLKQEVFSHGQLYTAFTRTTSGENMTLAIPDNLKESRLTKNVVWRQALEG